MEAHVEIHIEDMVLKLKSTDIAIKKAFKDREKEITSMAVEAVRTFDFNKSVRSLVDMEIERALESAFTNTIAPLALRNQIWDDVEKLVTAKYKEATLK